MISLNTKNLSSHEVVKLFCERVKLESKFHRFLNDDLIRQFILCFKGQCIKSSYSKKIVNPLEMALLFYKYYNLEYYKMIKDALKNKKIVINKVGKSFVDTGTGDAFITLMGDDSDLFILVHEFAHFIDRNLKPLLIPDKYIFLGETYAFYMEKQLELWLKLNSNSYDELISSRRNNRIYFESVMLKAIEYQLDCENLYRETGNISDSELIRDKVKLVVRYDYDLDVGLINYLIRYPLANVLSDYLVNLDIESDYEICRICLDTNLFELVDNFKNNLIKEK